MKFSLQRQYKNGRLLINLELPMMGDVEVARGLHASFYNDNGEELNLYNVSLDVIAKDVLILNGYEWQNNGCQVYQQWVLREYESEASHE